jgi:predicted glycogen debranching enzyme
VIDQLVRSVPFLPADVPEQYLTREWLVTNGLGGYASGTVSGVVTRRYHGLLVAALPDPLGRMAMLTHLWERLRLPDRTVVVLSGEDDPGRLDLRTAAPTPLQEFRLEGGLPVWRFAVGGITLEKRLLMPYRQNTVHVTYRLIAGEGPVRITLRPSVNFRPHEAPVDTPLAGRYTLTAAQGRYEVSIGPDQPPLRMALHGDRAALTIDEKHTQNILYRLEESRGYQAHGDLWSPGYFRADLRPGHDATLVASTEPWDTILALTPAEALGAERQRRQRLLDPMVEPARQGPAAELALAADQFIVVPQGRREDHARARAVGDELRSVIAGYHWFTDWGRDTMISLEGLALVTGRHLEAGYILRTFAAYVRDGLIPNLFPEGDRTGLYHTADATLWFFHALDRYLAITGDRGTLARLLPTLTGIVDAHLRGTRFGIGVDPVDGLLRQGAPGYQLTWMDAKVDSWVVTPRRGKAVEINALWYNALQLLARWLEEERGDGAPGKFAEHADLARASFNARFWYAAGGHLYDVIDGEGGDDPACRPNQLFAVSLPTAVLDPGRWRAVVDTVQQRLLTPVGLRSLSPDHPDYKSRYYGDLRARDAAYHQGTVWAWLIGPFIDAWLRVYPDDRPGARKFLLGLIPHLEEACIGSISEIFDAEPPFTPRGCVAQAWSVAEVLRAWVRTASEEPR